MAEISWIAKTATALVTNGLSLATGVRSALSSEYDNATNLHTFALFEIKEVAFGTAPTADTLLEIYLIPAVDGTNYADGSDSVIPASNLLVGWFVLKNQTGNQRLASMGLTRDYIVIPPHKFKVLIWNRANQTLSANWDLSIYPFRYQSA